MTRRAKRHQKFATLVKTNPKPASSYHVELSTRRTKMPAHCYSAVIPVEHWLAQWLCNSWVMCPRIAVCFLKVSRDPPLPIHNDLVRPARRARRVPLVDVRRHEPAFDTKMREDGFSADGHTTAILDLFREAALTVHGCASTQFLIRFC